MPVSSEVPDCGETAVRNGSAGVTRSFIRTLGSVSFGKVKKPRREPWLANHLEGLLLGFLLGLASGTWRLLTSGSLRLVGGWSSLSSNGATTAFLSPRRFGLRFSRSNGFNHRSRRGALDPDFQRALHIRVKVE